MIRHEIRKYLRRFRWLILAYVLWLGLTTLLSTTHAAFVAPFSGIRSFAWQCELWATAVSWILLSMLMLQLWLEDCVWDPKAFWQPRPVSRKDHLMAKCWVLVLLGLFLPILSNSLVMLTAGMSLAETIVNSLRHGAMFFMVGGFASSIALVSKQWHHIGAILALHIPAFMFHAMCWAVIREHGFPMDLLYAMLGIVVSVSAFWIAYRRPHLEPSALAVIGGNLILVPLFFAVSFVINVPERWQQILTVLNKPDYQLHTEIAKFQHEPPRIDVTAWLEPDDPSRSWDGVPIRPTFTTLGGEANELTVAFQQTQGRKRQLTLTSADGEAFPSRGTVSFDLACRVEDERWLAKIPVAPGTHQLSEGFKVHLETTSHGTSLVRYWHQERLLEPKQERHVTLNPSDRRLAIHRWWPAQERRLGEVNYGKALPTGTEVIAIERTKRRPERKTVTLEIP